MTALLHLYARILPYLGERLKEPSTLRALIWLATSAGLFKVNGGVGMDSVDAIITLGTLLVGLLGLLPDPKRTIVNAGTVMQAGTVDNANVVMTENAVVTGTPVGPPKP